MAQTYGIYNYRSLPASLVATLTVGLGDDSRLSKKLSGIDVSIDRLLLAGILDKLATLVWFNSEDGQKGENRPRSVVAQFLGITEEDNKSNVQGFSSPTDFEAQRARLLGGGA